MAAVAVPPDVTSRLEGEWNESQIESALARLQEMHAQLRYLRDAIPRLIDPLLTQQPSPEDLYNNFAANVTAIRSDVKNFSESFRDDEYRELLKKAEDIRAQSSEDIPAWRVTEHEDWLDVRNVASLMDIAADERNGADSDVNEKAITEPGYLRAAIGKFRKDNPSIEASLDENSRIVMVTLLPHTHTHFKIECQPSLEGQSVYTVTTTQKSNMHAAMVNAIMRRSQPNNLDHLLEMLASYTDITSRPCSKCHRLLDPNAQFPVVRSKKKSKQSDGKYKLAWQAYHSSCN